MSTLLKFCLFLIALCLVVALTGYLSFTTISSLRYVTPRRTAFMVFRGGPVQQKTVPLSRISPHLRRAVIVSEDSLFYQHDGIDFHEMEEAIKKNIREREYARGFSTITMQLARNLYLSPQKTLLRKFLEILITWRMERALSKDRILELYLNVVEWGKGIYGAEMASQYYFKKPAADLTAEESAFLAVILPNPRKWGHWPPGPYVRKRMETIEARM